MTRIADYVAETASNPGTGTVSLAGATTGRRSFVAALGAGGVYYYITDGVQAEWGSGTIAAGTPNTLSRDTVLGNTAGTTAKLNFTGTVTVYNALPADVATQYWPATNAEVQAGTDATKAVTPASLSARTATDTRTGLVELATDAEVQTGTDTSRAVTSAGLAARTATETRTGLVELATSAEVQAGTDTSRAVTPAGLTSAFGRSLAASGYQRLPGGLIIQWGATGSVVAPVAITFPLVYPSLCTYVGISTIYGGGFSTNMPSTMTSSGFTINLDYGGAASHRWVAIGY